MAQWINILWNNSFGNPMQLPLLREKTGALGIVKPGLTAGKLAGRYAGETVVIQIVYKLIIISLLKYVVIKHLEYIKETSTI